MTVENCGNCAFGVERWGHQVKETFCHLRAPIVFEGITGYKQSPALSGEISFLEDIRGPVTAWPRVSETDFCGQWELQDAK